MEWRYHHVKMVERTIGSRPGTGGSAGAAYLRTTLHKPFFPDLWAVRSELDLRGRARAALLGVSRLRASAPDWALAPGLAERRPRGRDRGLGRRGAPRRREVGPSVRKGGPGSRRFRLWLEAPGAELALDQDTFGLVLRFLSALDLRRRPRLVTTSGEFHTLRRLMARLAEEELLDVVVMDARRPRPRRAARGQTNERTAAVLVSAVLFEDSAGSRGSTSSRRPARRAVPSSSSRLPRARCHVVSSGRPRLGLGRQQRLQVPPARQGQLLPPRAASRRRATAPLHGVVCRVRRTGREETPAHWCPRGGMRFAGATYDPTATIAPRASSTSSRSRASRLIRSARLPPADDAAGRRSRNRGAA